jgi:hypothetical protein
MAGFVPPSVSVVKVLMASFALLSLLVTAGYARPHRLLLKNNA